MRMLIIIIVMVLCSRAGSPSPSAQCLVTGCCRNCIATGEGKLSKLPQDFVFGVRWKRKTIERHGWVLGWVDGCCCLFSLSNDASLRIVERNETVSYFWMLDFGILFWIFILVAYTFPWASYEFCTSISTPNPCSFTEPAIFPFLKRSDFHKTQCQDR